MQRGFSSYATIQNLIKNVMILNNSSSASVFLVPLSASVISHAGSTSCPGQWRDIWDIHTVTLSKKSSINNGIIISNGFHTLELA